MDNPFSQNGQTPGFGQAPSSQFGAGAPGTDVAAQAENALGQAATGLGNFAEKIWNGLTGIIKSIFGWLLGSGKGGNQPGAHPGFGGGMSNKLHGKHGGGMMPPGMEMPPMGMMGGFEPNPHEFGPPFPHFHGGGGHMHFGGGGRGRGHR